MKLHLASLCAISLLGASPAFAANSAGCTTNAANGGIVNGQTLWEDVPMASGQRSATDCDVDQFAWNNFLHLVSNDSGGHPRFMSLAPWNQALPKSGKPTWTGKYTPLETSQMLSNLNQLQAGDDFHLLDVGGKTVTYDIRVNQDFVNFIASSGTYTTQAIAKQTASFTKDSSTGGIWLPPTSPDSKQFALELKTAWREFGQNCPADIMHCETDSAGKQWGLIGMHLVQKTPQHGEMIWASFEHIANSPDCGSGGNNPIVQNPNGLNANQKIGDLKDKTGWNLFDYSSYKKAGGDGKTCSFPQTGKDDGQCLKDPNPSGDNKTWLSVNVCRTDALPPATGCETANDNLAIASCLNSSVQQNLPSSLAAKWKNYRLIGAEYVFWGSTGTGAPLVGCWNFKDGPKNEFGLQCVADKSGEISVALRGTVNLANTTMETWMQKGINLTAANKNVGTLVGQDCFSCHQPTTASYQGDMSHLFGRAQQIGDVEAGPIWNDGDAKQKCPTVCQKAGGDWNGQWTTTSPGQMSVCGCVKNN